MSEQIIRARADATKGITKTSAIPAKYLRDAEILHVFRTVSTFDLVFYISFISLAAVCIGLFHSDWKIYLTVGEMLVGLLASNLIARGKIAGIWINIIDCCMFGVIAYISKAYGELVKVAIISNAFNIYGIINWSRAAKKSKSSSNEIVVKSMGKKMSAIVYSSFVVLCVASFFALRAVGTTQVYIACITFSCNIAIKTLQMSRYREAWYFSILTDILAAVMWILILVENVSKSGDWSVLPTAGSAIGFLANAINGLIIWNKLYKKNKLSGSVYLANRPVVIKKFIKLSHNYNHLIWDISHDHVTTEDEIKYAKRLGISFRRGMFSDR